MFFNLFMVFQIITIITSIITCFCKKKQIKKSCYNYFCLILEFNILKSLKSDKQQDIKTFSKCILSYCSDSF